MYKIEMIDIDELKPNPKNPRQITKKDFEKLVKSLKDCPELFNARPCLVSNSTGENIILGGNMRFKAAQKLKYKEVPCIIMSNLTEAQEREIIIKDNGLFGEFDYDAIANTWSDLPLSDWGVPIPDYSLKEADIEIINQEQEEKESKKNEGKNTIECPECGHRFSK